MSMGVAIIIFFVSLIALVAEFILYFIMGMGASFSGGVSSLSGIAFFFVGLMLLTLATGILAPISAIIGVIFKRKSIANKFLAVSLLLVGGFYFIGMPMLGKDKVAKIKKTYSEETAVKGKSVKQDEPGSTKNIPR